MKKRLTIILTLFLILSFSAIATAADADNAWKQLMNGNQRFASGEQTVRDFSIRRAELITGQYPIATIVSCSDSRVPPELLFDQGLGDLFIVRVAGNVVGPIELGSIEYSIEHLHVPLIIVLGHQSCGAVSAALQGPAGGNIRSITDQIEPAVEIAKTKPGNLLDNAIDENVKLGIKNILENSPITEEYVKEEKVTIIGAKYHLDTGKVEVIEIENDTAHSTTPGFEAILAIASFFAVIYWHHKD
ncbi:MAG: carbonic anhydrase [Candidatus Woesearchaeota archaeon]|nr:carbonic anhydrase [Candidatus Woesearchaeota archaeon]